ncbi:uncharacterized protein LOC116603710 [Nematostella vectensis]|uniref:uncharacterized protein LOC116603710 n=1 Tax=Nematostella vectensis TaxID=45351 RepID=UPI0013900DF3|nr:uncharacterized protein LOC116603710 [Nematostella vectensis]
MKSGLFRISPLLERFCSVRLLCTIMGAGGDSKGIMQPVCFQLTASTLSKLLSVALICAILLNSVEGRPSMKSASTSRKHKSFSMIMCGKLGDLCRVHSRKHCCAEGFTCVQKLKIKKNRIHYSKFGRCQPVPTLAPNDMELLEEHSLRETR